jgi:hypothetical protein
MPIHSNRSILSLLLILLLTACAAPQPTPSVPPSLTLTPTVTASPTRTVTPSPTPVPRPLLMAHYMPWYQAPPTSAEWGYHWTMNHFKPAQKADGAWENFASHYTPLTGLYDSSDPALLDYQVQLMKLSGIDGVIVDWYGMEDFWDYGMLNQATGKLFAAIKRAGLKFAICYEDQTVLHMVENKHIPQEQAVAHAQKVMRYLQETWFEDDAYLKFNGRPVLFNYGPLYFKDDASWKTIFSGLPQPPVFVVKDTVAFTSETAAYPWPPMYYSQSGVLSQGSLNTYLDAFYQRAQGWPYKVGGAFPGFNDIYKEAGVSAGNGFLDAQDGRTFHDTLQTALDQHPDLIQLITWNDYGEGTNIEPTVEYGYRYLEMVQQARQAANAGFAYRKDDLRLPLELYQARLKHAAEAGITKKLTEAAQKILDGDIKGAREMIQAVQ